MIELVANAISIFSLGLEVGDAAARVESSSGTPGSVLQHGKCSRWSSVRRTRYSAGEIGNCAHSVKILVACWGRLELTYEHRGQG